MPLASPFFFMVAINTLPKEREVDEEEFNFGIQTWWNKVFDEAKETLEYELKECAKEAYDLTIHKKGDLQLVAVIPTKLALWLDCQYGEGWRKDKDFMNCYRRYVGQTFLPEISSQFGEA